MKSYAFAFALVCLLNTARSQDTIRRLEFGSTLLTVNSLNNAYFYAPDRPAFEFLNGVFFRYTKNRIGFRVHSGYGEYAVIYSSPPERADGVSGDLSSKDFRIGAGIQRSLLKRSNWMYAFLDVSYRNVFSTGHQYGGIWGVAERFSSSANGFDYFAGLGFRMKVIRNVYLSFEPGLYSSTRFVSRSTEPIAGGQPVKSRYTVTDVNAPVIKVHLTVRFQ